MSIDKLYDPECHGLATYFLEDEPSDEPISDKQARINRHELAYAIQCAVEDWLEENRELSRAAGSTP